MVRSIKIKTPQLKSESHRLEILTSTGWKPFHEFPNRVKQFEIIPNGQVIVITVLEKGTTDRNIYLLNSDGTIKWQIQEAQRDEGRPNPYGGFRYKNGKLVAVSVAGADYKVDLDTGQIKFSDFNRF